MIRPSPPRPCPTVTARPSLAESRLSTQVRGQGAHRERIDDQQGERDAARDAQPAVPPQEGARARRRARGLEAGAPPAPGGQGRRKQGPRDTTRAEGPRVCQLLQARALSARSGRARGLEVDTIRGRDGASGTESRASSRRCAGGSCCAPAWRPRATAPRRWGSACSRWGCRRRRSVLPTSGRR